MTIDDNIKHLLIIALGCGVGISLLSGCGSAPKKRSAVHYPQAKIIASNPVPSNTHNNICAVLRSNPDWYLDAQRSAQRWGTPVAVQFAFVKQESSFNPHASPSTTTAYGYSQALNGTWDDYVKSTGNYTGHRSNMKDSLDFIGWYNRNSFQRIGLKGNQVRDLYLAYHEGITGYSQGSHRKKQWLLDVATRVHNQAVQYDKQLRSCNNEILALATRQSNKRQL